MRGRMQEADPDGWPALQSVADRQVPGSGTIEVQRLGKGLVNDTYRLLRDGRAYALRAAVANSRDLGLDHHWEARVLEGAVAADLAPAVVYSEPERGILISRWVDGNCVRPEDTPRPAILSSMAGLLRRIHALPMPAPARVMTPGQWMDYYSRPASPAASASRSAALRSVALERLSALAGLPSAAAVMCHSDLHILNLIERGGSLMLLDWEYAHVSDPFWDLAGWSANNDFENDTSRELLAKYLGRTPVPEECLRLGLLGWLYDYVCLLWSELYLNPDRTQAGRGHGDSAIREVAARAELLEARLHSPQAALDAPRAPAGASK
jgi:thiamine kinase